MVFSNTDRPFPDEVPNPFAPDPVDPPEPLHIDIRARDETHEAWHRFEQSFHKPTPVNSSPRWGLMALVLAFGLVLGTILGVELVAPWLVGL